MTACASFSFSFQSSRDVQIIVTALSPEITHTIPKTKVYVESHGNQFTLTISAPDVHTLRAACNSYLRWIQTAITIKKLL